MSKPPMIGTVWIARATLFNSAGKKVGTCMDTPNSIAKALMEVPQATSVSCLMSQGGYLNRDDFAGRMNKWNTCESSLVRVSKGNRTTGMARRRPRLSR